MEKKISGWGQFLWIWCSFSNTCLWKDGTDILNISTAHMPNILIANLDLPHKHVVCSDTHNFGYLFETRSFGGEYGEILK